LPIDNVSSLPEWFSDALCRIATGMSYTKRMLFTDQDEILIRATRPIALTSVVEVITAPDLGDRSIMLVPPKIEEKTRREEAEVLADFEKERPAILAALPDRPEPPDGNPLKTQPLGGMGGLGGSLHTIGGEDPCSTESLTDAPLPTSCKIPPEPPDTAETINGRNGLDFGRLPGGSSAGNGQPPEPDMRCDHCGAPATADSPVQLVAVEGEEILLHRHCQAGWLSERDTPTPPDLSIPPFLQRTPSEEN
jgi:hypothetical protein